MTSNRNFFKKTKTLPVDKFLEKVLFDKKDGYYSSNIPFGKKGDYLTAPGLSNLFSEVIGIWFVSSWNALGKPKKLNIVELGPGDGNLTKVLIKTFKSFPEFNKATNIFLYEKSKLLKNLQKKNINNARIKWIDNFSKNLYLQYLDINDFDISFVKGLSLENGCATLTKFSAYLIAKGIEYINDSNNFLTKNLVCGGGRKNIFLIEIINKFLSLKKIYLENIDNYELAGDFIESQGFAYLAIRSYLGLPISFPSTTGCKVPTKGGTYIKNF